MLDKGLQFILKERRNAIILVALASFIPFLSWLVIAIVALVTLQKGMGEGAKLCAVVFIPALVYLLIGYTEFIVQSVLLIAVLVWCLSVVLKRTLSWVLVLELSILFGLFGIIILYTFFPEWVSGFVTALQSQYLEFLVEFGIDNNQDQMIHVTNLIGRVAVGAFIYIMLAHVLFLLGLGRYFQSRLYNPGGFKKEFYAITFNWFPGLLLVLSVLGVFADISLAREFLCIAMLPFLIVGLSIVHHAANKKAYPKTLLTIFYLSLLGIPLISMLLVLLALLDKRFNFRAQTNIQ